MMEAASIIVHYRHGTYRDFAQEHRSGGTFRVDMFEAHQEPIETSDPAYSQFVFYEVLAPIDPFETNFGYGWKQHATRHRFIDLHPANASSDLRLPKLSHRAAVVPCFEITQALDRHGLEPDALSGIVERFLNLPRAIAALDAMWAAAARIDPAAGLDLDGAVLTMLGELIAACGYGLPLAPRLDDRRLARAVDYAETHIAAPLTVGELAGAAAMSPSAFSRAFRAATGETPWAFVRRRRLERAGEAMARTNDTLTQIAADCGFSDASHLARCWKQAFGTTPRGG